MNIASISRENKIFQISTFASSIRAPDGEVSKSHQGQPKASPLVWVLYHASLLQSLTQKKSNFALEKAKLSCLASWLSFALPHGKVTFLLCQRL